jgi:hypothetical protein
MQNIWCLTSKYRSIAGRGGKYHYGGEGGLKYVRCSDKYLLTALQFIESVKTIRFSSNLSAIAIIPFFNAKLPRPRP